MLAHVDKVWLCVSNYVPTHLCCVCYPAQQKSELASIYLFFFVASGSQQSTGFFQFSSGNNVNGISFHLFFSLLLPHVSLYSTNVVTLKMELVARKQKKEKLETSEYIFFSWFHSFQFSPLLYAHNGSMQI